MSISTVNMRSIYRIINNPPFFQRLLFYWSIYLCEIFYTIEKYINQYINSGNSIWYSIYEFWELKWSFLWAYVIPYAIYFTRKSRFLFSCFIYINQNKWSIESIACTLPYITVVSCSPCSIYGIRPILHKK